MLFHNFTFCDTPIQYYRNIPRIMAEFSLIFHSSIVPVNTVIYWSKLILCESKANNYWDLF